MNEEDLKNLNDFIKEYSNNRNSNNNSNSNSSVNDEDENNDEMGSDGYGYDEWGCNDMPGGFQLINPRIFMIIGEILGNVMAGRIPFNVQNSLGNWIQLVGQAIETYGAQQQYFQSGPGRFYEYKYYNVNNPFCPNNGRANNASQPNSSPADSESNEQEVEIFNEISSILKQLTVEINDVKRKVNDFEDKK